MFDPFTFDSRWTLGLGLPLIAWLLVLIWRRTRAVKLRIREVREEMARSPQDPYMALAMLTEERKTSKKTKTKITTRTKPKTQEEGRTWRKG